MLRVFIIGTTGVGKTKLSVALASRLKGEIISSDSKQLYKHASIMTAKVTEEEAQGVPHHMVDCLQLHQNEFNRNKFMDSAGGIMKGIEARERMPVVVGGTNYYTETLLFRQGESQSSPENEEKMKQEEAGFSPEIDEQVEAMKQMSKQDKFSLLEKHDPTMAAKVHRNDQQKITLFLERIIRSGQPVSANYLKAEPLPQTGRQIVFWVRNSNREELFGMVEKRIKDMLSKEGLTEIFSVYYYIELFQRRQLKHLNVKEFENYSGAGSSIGLRQFKELYLEAKQQLQNLFKDKNVNDHHNYPVYPLIHQHILSHIHEIKFSPQTLKKCQQQLLTDTKQYCKRQITWIRNRMFANPLHRQRFFVLELSQQKEEPERKLMERFEAQVLGKALKVVESIAKEGFGSIVEKEEEFMTESKVEPLEEWKKYYCEACQQELNGYFSWKSHLQSKRHQKQQRYLEKKEERETFINEQRELAAVRREEKAKQGVQKEPEMVDLGQGLA